MTYKYYQTKDGQGFEASDLARAAPTKSFCTHLLCVDVHTRKPASKPRVTVIPSNNHFWPVACSNVKQVATLIPAYMVVPS